MNLLSNPNIIKSFPQKRQQILELCAKDVVVSELCEDYDEIIDAIIEAIAKADSHTNNALRSSSSLLELAELKKKLEQELMERLERQ
ncbi:MAG: hypothetical protein IME94_02795 [Proteobacteria bacterium]|nr:hypothetical protein [Pseudomonadota bacterium]